MDTVLSLQHLNILFTVLKLIGQFWQL